jgi:hypothetical protein
MTEAEIMKALECCSKDEINGLNIFTYGDVPMRSLLKYALDLINRKNEELRQYAYEHTELMKKVDRQKAEIEKWQQVNFDLCTVGGKLLHERKTIRAEAIKEVLQRVKEKTAYLFSAVSIKYELDQIAKDLKEREKE